MGAKARASSAAVVASRGGVGLAADNLFYTPGETLKLSLTNVNGEIAWEATGGAKFTTSAGCTNGKRSAARAPFLVMPVGGVNTVQIWAGHASGHNAVSITPTITLTPRAPPPTTPAPTNSAVVAPGGGGGVVTPAAPTTPAPTPSPASSSNSGKTNVYAAVFNARVSTVIAANFRVDIAQTLVADTATLVPSQVYVVASAPSLFRRFLQAGSSATDVTIRLTNLPDLATANALVGTVGSYLQSPLATGFGAQYGNAAATPGTPTVVLQSSAATTFTVGALHASCVLDARQGVALSWQLDPDLQYVDLQVEGKGEGWLAGGLVDAHTSMVSTPPHKVLLFDYGTGEAQFLRMQGYEAVDLKPADAATYGVSPIFLQGAEGKVYMRYRQSLATASVPVDLGATTNFMWAWAEFGYPAMHDLEGDTIINWAAGTCTPRMNLPPIEGYWLLLVPFLALLVTWTFLKSTECGRGLLQRRLAAITPLPAWVQTFTGHSLPTLQNLKLGEASVMIIYILLQAALLLYWSLQEGGLGFKSTGIAFGKAGLTNLMMTYLPVSKTSVWVQVCGLSFERAVKFHRQLSYLAMGTMLIHLVCLAQVGPVWQTTALESGVVIAYGLLAFASFSVMSLTAMLRRWCYELFRYAHYLYIVGTVFVLLHAPGAWQYMLVPCLVHFMDVGRRWVSIWCCPTTARLHTFPDQITQIDVFSSSAAAADGKWKKPLEPGSYAFVCLPAVSRFQWHPISLSTAGSVVGNGDALFSLHVKALGKGTWTNQVYQLAAQGPATPHSHETTAQVTSDDATTASAPPLPLTIWVDGPYGKLSLNLGYVLPTPTHPPTHLRMCRTASHSNRFFFPTEITASWCSLPGGLGSPP